MEICPRCGKPIAYIERHRRGSRYYYYAVHKENKRRRKCYLGPRRYEYVSRLHEATGEPIDFKGAVDTNRLIKYLEDIADLLSKRRLEGDQPSRISRVARKLMAVAGKELAEGIKE